MSTAGGWRKPGSWSKAVRRAAELRAIPGLSTTGDYREVLGADDVDAVMISTPDHWHAPMAIAAAKAGKHVALEKPITRTVAEGQAIIDAIKQNQRVFRMDSEMRSRTWLHQMAEIVRNGGCGRDHRGACRRAGRRRRRVSRDARHARPQRTGLRDVARCCAARLRTRWSECTRPESSVAPVGCECSTTPTG